MIFLCLYCLTDYIILPINEQQIRRIGLRVDRIWLSVGKVYDMICPKLMLILRLFMQVFTGPMLHDAQLLSLYTFIYW